MNSVGHGAFLSTYSMYTVDVHVPVLIVKNNCPCFFVNSINIICMHFLSFAF